MPKKKRKANANDFWTDRCSINTDALGHLIYISDPVTPEIRKSGYEGANLENIKPYEWKKDYELPGLDLSGKEK